MGTDSLCWEPRQLRTPSGERLFGGGVQYGTWTEEAHKHTPVGGFPAPFVFNWDSGTNGQQYSTTSSTPLVLQVGNSNSASMKNSIVLTYLSYPACPSKKVREKKKDGLSVWRAVQMDVVQQTFRMIRDALAPAAVHGFKASIHGKDKYLFPKICSIILDHPERTTFVQARHSRFSTTQRLRRGRSINRTAATPQRESDVVPLLRDIRHLKGMRGRLNKKRARTLVSTLARRHCLYPFPHCLSGDADRLGACPPQLLLPTEEGMFSVLLPDTFHFKHNLASFVLDELQDALRCVYTCHSHSTIAVKNN